MLAIEARYLRPSPAISADQLDRSISRIPTKDFHNSWVPRVTLLPFLAYFQFNSKWCFHAVMFLVVAISSRDNATIF